MEAQGGILLLDKPVGPTSHDIVARARKAAGIRRVGHAGTLDPFASGLLILLLGPATRLSEHLLGLDKEYLATARLGVTTDTGDPEGEIVEESTGWMELERTTIGEALASFRGKILQEPPAFSAKKVRGEAAHRRVRRGESVTLEPVEVKIHEIELLEVASPSVQFRVRCSSGTYIRSLARDLGMKLQVGAHLTDLRRTRIGRFSLEQALSTSEMERDSSWGNRLLSPAQALAHLPSVSVDPEEARRLRQGQNIAAGAGVSPGKTPLRILLKEELVAVGSVKNGRIWPRKVFGVES